MYDEIINYIIEGQSEVLTSKVPFGPGIYNSGFSLITRNNLCLSLRPRHRQPRITRHFYPFQPILLSIINSSLSLLFWEKGPSFMQSCPSTFTLHAVSPTSFSHTHLPSPQPVNSFVSVIWHIIPIPLWLTSASSHVNLQPPPLIIHATVKLF